MEHTYQTPTTPLIAAKGYLYLPEQEHPLELKELTVFGSCEEATVRSSELSERHCRIENKGFFFVLRDLRSRTGTYLNGKTVFESILTEGDLIEIGHQAFVFSTNPESRPEGVGLSSKNVAWNKQLQTIGKLSRTPYTVLITGPSGSGKELLARALHENSPRSKAPFVTVNCSAFTETLIESELFGHVKGSFTGALADRKGAFESARGGTLFLDEIGDMPLGMQAKILRALENNEIRPVGADKNVTTDVRILAATHQDLWSRAQSGEFRLDLYYRLHILSLSAPALRDRPEDIEDLTMEFAKQFKVRFHVETLQQLSTYAWLGNIRELKNFVMRCSALLPRQQILPQHLEYLLPHAQKSIAPGVALPVEIAPHQNYVPSSTLPVIKEIERQMIVKRLAANFGNQRRTAQDLGIPKSTLHDRLKTYNIDSRSFSKRSKR